MEMLYRMYDLCDGDIIRTLEHSNLCFEDLIAYSSAISSIEVYDNIGFADTGRDCPEALIANVSDFILDIMEVSFSVVYSRRDNGVKISVRSEGVALDAGKITAEALEGIGNGGGHPEMAGGFVPFEGSERQEVILTDQIKERFSNVVSRVLAKTLDNDKA
jgi:nanoRNase/pAp phosphatase (c-di-AMP/oligoRNAs hydrolase)